MQQNHSLAARYWRIEKGLAKIEVKTRQAVQPMNILVGCGAPKAFEPNMRMKITAADDSEAFILAGFEKHGC